MPVVYTVAVLCGLQYMKSREPYSLKMFSIVHSSYLCIASLVMALGISYGALLKAAAQGPLSLFCDSGAELKGTMTFWMYVYWLSKFPELLDTLILVLRKKKVIFLHVFHHAAMTLMPSLWLRGNWTVVWFGCWLNCIIHVFMYFYYAAAAAVQYNPWWKKWLTSAQIVQFIMVFGVIIAFFFYRDYLGHPCQGDTAIIWLSQAVNLVFLFFFVKFFVESYSGKRQSKQKSK